MIELTESQTYQVITTICQKHGCTIKEINLERHIVDLDGPPDAQEKCKLELEAFLD